MNRRTKWMVVAAGVAVAGVVGGGAALATSQDEADTPITGDALDRASTAALDHVGGGTVTATEVGDEDSYYEVEVTHTDGSQVDVQLDADFQVTSQDEDSESGDSTSED
jgi:uncharacterized membrane protein YkoI